MTKGNKMKNRLYFGIFFAALASVAICEYQIKLTGFQLLPGLCNETYIFPGTKNPIVVKQENPNEYVVSGDIEFRRDFIQNDIIKIEYFHKIWTGKYALLYIVYISICELTRHHYYPLFAKVSNFPSRCPVLKGNYTVNNFRVNETFFPSTLPQGDHILIFTLYSDQQHVYGIKLATNIKEI
ncbi:uncharacterized protein LOC116343058 [Contarinia nasturtii]|uniref:uncharacterized protein LOC116343058 n=1 Tax=Contarinia nasturtii TaxID=265458 RepID=UPI0012D471A0|nr:uncharacterized protein LOC116343058 [Contarinia nasturtii]